MGYEHRFYIVEHTEGQTYVIPIATYDLCRADNFKYKNFFKEKFEGRLFISGDEDVDEDCYGEPLMYTTNLKELANYLEELNEKEPDGYRRFMPLVGLLRSFKPKEWNTLKVIHYGH